MKSTSSRQRINTYINPIVIKRAKAQALAEGKSVSDIIETALISYLPAVTKIEFKVEDRPSVGPGISIQYDEKELMFLSEQSLKESREGKTKVIDTPEKLEEDFEELRRYANKS